MEIEELKNNQYSLIMTLPKVESNVAAHTFLRSLEDCVMGYTLAEVELTDYSECNLFDAITDHQTGELLSEAYQEIMNLHTNPHDYIQNLLWQVQQLINWFLKEEFEKFRLLTEVYNIRDIDSTWYGDKVIMILTGEKIR